MPVSATSPTVSGFLAMALLLFLVNEAAVGMAEAGVRAEPEAEALVDEAAHSRRDRAGKEKAAAVAAAAEPWEAA